jgi:hypothetical protein
VSPAGPGEDIRVVVPGGEQLRVPGGEQLHGPAEAQPAAPRESRQHLRLIEQRAARRANRRRLVFSLGIAGGAVVCLALVALHVLIAENQFKLDQLQARASAEQVRYERLRLQVAQLEAPARIVSEAEGKLGMVQPGSVTYLPAIAASPAPTTTGTGASTKGTSGNATPANSSSANGKVTTGEVTGRQPAGSEAARKPAGGATSQRATGTPASGPPASGPPVTETVSAPEGDADWPSIKPYLSGNP